jgi:hypothetical protein
MLHGGDGIDLVADLLVAKVQALRPLPVHDDQFDPAEIGSVLFGNRVLQFQAQDGFFTSPTRSSSWAILAPLWARKRGEKKGSDPD